MSEFVTIKPAQNAVGKPLRIPMPAGLGLPGHGAILPAEGASVPVGDHFVQRLITDGDVVIVKPDTPAAEPPAPSPASGEHE